MTIDMNSQSNGALNIYRKYKSIYLKDREILSSVQKVSAAASKPERVFEEYSQFAANFSVVAALSEKLGINQKLLLALGATEKIEYDDITSGKYIPPEIEERSAPRVYKLDSYIRSLYIEWSQLRIFYRFQRPGSDISRLIEGVGIPRAELPSIIAELPDISDDYLQRFEYVRWHLKPRDIVAFCIQTFCEKVLKILSIEGKGAVIASAFAKYIIAKILRNDELVTKPGYFSWSLVFGDKESKREMIEEGDADGTDARESEQVQDDAAEVAMSLDAFDVEEDPDADPDDDPGNQVRVSDEYGI
jgi:hypothetical protein